MGNQEVNLTPLFTYPAFHFLSVESGALQHDTVLPPLFVRRLFGRYTKEITSSSAGHSPVEDISRKCINRLESKYR